jgi:hypothetical protein
MKNSNPLRKIRAQRVRWVNKKPLTQGGVDQRLERLISINFASIAKFFSDTVNVINYCFVVAAIILKKSNFSVWTNIMFNVIKEDT